MAVEWTGASKAHSFNRQVESGWIFSPSCAKKLLEEGASRHALLGMHVTSQTLKLIADISKPAIACTHLSFKEDQIGDKGPALPSQGSHQRDLGSSGPYLI